MKSQTQVIQFVLLFLISLSIFSLVSSYIFYFSYSSQDRLLSSFRELLTSYISGSLITTYTNCKYCNYSNATYWIPYKVFDNFHEVIAASDMIYIKSTPTQKQSSSSIHNLNYTAEFVGFYSTGISSSLYNLTGTSPLPIFFNKTEVKFKIGG
jgi:hypothetical protein